MKTALVAGASGLVGGHLAEYLARQEGWRVVGISRRKGAPDGDLRHVALDLLDDEACRDGIGDLRDVTHIFYAARAGRSDPREEAEVNRRMLRNVVDAVERVSPALAHVCLVHGTKWYGSHLGPYRTPAREDDPRHAGANFYYDQYDDIAARQAGKAWTWSTLRPHIVCGVSVDYPYNLITLLGVYGSLCREFGRPMSFPGTAACFDSVSQATDIDLLCAAAHWAATTTRCANQSFNIVNADYFRWRDLWPRLADFFGVACGTVEPASLVAAMADSDAAWNAVVARHGLRPLARRSLANWAFGDFLFAAGWDDMSSTAKARSYGFDKIVESEPMFLARLQQLRDARIIP